MGHNFSDKSKRRIRLVFDLLATICSYYLAIGIRFHFQMASWQRQLYRTVLLFALLICVFLFTYRHLRGRFVNIQEMDPLENLIRVIRDRFLLYVILVLFLAVTRFISQISFRFLFIMAVLDVILDYLFRMADRKILLRQQQTAPLKERVLIVSEQARIPAAVFRFLDGLPETTRAQAIAGIAVVSSGTFENPSETFNCSAEALKKETAKKPAVPEKADVSEVPEAKGKPDGHHGTVEISLPDGRKVPVLGTVEELLCPERVYEKTEDRGGNDPSTKEEELKEIRFNRVYLYLPDAGSGEIASILKQCDAIGVPADVCLTMCGTGIPRKMILGGSGIPGSTETGNYHYAVAEYTNMKTHCNVLGVNFAVTNAEAAARFILNHLQSLRGKYICFSNVHTTVMAREDAAYCTIQNGAAYTFADGAPIAAVERYQGFTGVERCAGPDFMDAVFRATMDGSIGHYFYGSTQETLDLLEKNLPARYPGIRICGMFSPPFRKLEEVPGEDDLADIQRINESGAAIIWIGLGAPKQERWMALHQGKLSGTMFGVGAGFNFYAGNIKRAPKVIQRMGLEWLYRLFQDPKHLLHRYLVTNVKFFWYLLLEPFRRKK